jgi:hypothetical protein
VFVMTNAWEDQKVSRTRRHFSMEGYVSHLTESPSSIACLHKFTCFVGPDIPDLPQEAHFWYGCGSWFCVLLMAELHLFSRNYFPAG